MDPEMQMAPRRHPGAVDTGDILAHLYGLPDVHQGSAVDDMPVGRLVAAATVVADTDVVAITAKWPASVTVFTALAAASSYFRWAACAEFPFLHGIRLRGRDGGLQRRQKLVQGGGLGLFGRFALPGILHIGIAWIAGGKSCGGRTDDASARQQREHRKAR